MDVSGLLQRLEEAGAGRQRSAAGPLVPKEPDPAVEVAVEAEMNKGSRMFVRASFFGAKSQIRFAFDKQKDTN